MTNFPAVRSRIRFELRRTERPRLLRQDYKSAKTEISLEPHRRQEPAVSHRAEPHESPRGPPRPSQVPGDRL